LLPDFFSLEIKLNLFWLYITSLSKEIKLCFQFDSFSYGPAVHLIRWKTFVSHLHWLHLLAYKIMLQWKRLNWVTLD